MHVLFWRLVAKKKKLMESYFLYVTVCLQKFLEILMVIEKTEMNVA